jgi:hypothetical protein
MGSGGGGARKGWRAGGLARGSAERIRRHEARAGGRTECWGGARGQREWVEPANHKGVRGGPLRRHPLRDARVVGLGPDLLLRRDRASQDQDAEQTDERKAERSNGIMGRHSHNIAAAPLLLKEELRFAGAGASEPPNNPSRQPVTGIPAPLLVQSATPRTIHVASAVRRPLGFVAARVGHPSGDAGALVHRCRGTPSSQPHPGMVDAPRFQVESLGGTPINPINDGGTFTWQLGTPRSALRRVNGSPEP